LIRSVAYRKDLPIEVGHTVCEINIVAKGADLGGTLTIETVVELAADLNHNEPFIARKRGSILWSDQTKVHLEGGAGLLPVAPVSFSEAGLPGNAAWYVSMDGGDWEQAAMGSLLILLNEDNSVVRKAMQGSSEEASILWATLEVDIVADLVGRALDDEAFMDYPTSEDPDGDLTMAGLIRALVRTYLLRPGEAVEQAVKRIGDERRRDPSRFRVSVQSGVKFLGGNS